MMIESAISQNELDTVFLPARAADLLGEAGCPTYLAVYVYALRQYQKGNRNLSNAAIADALKVSRIDVVNAFLFYNSQGLVKIHNFTSVDDGDFDVEFCNPGPAAKSPIPFRPSYRASEISRRLKDNPKMAQMYKMASQILGKTLSSADTELLYSFHDYYGLSVEVILVLIEYYVSKGKTSMKYMEKEAGKWVSAGVDSVEKAKGYIQKREDFLSYSSRIRTVLGICERNLSTRELTYINKWQNELSMSVEKVKEAYELTVNQTGKLSFAYLNKILESWARNAVAVPKSATAGTAKKPSRYDFSAFQRQALEDNSN
ncbi:MAG: DnaD domain protein [Clostridia bacterium]|nr:DnaD domain protein [Clostridia bacterium]